MTNKEVARLMARDIFATGDNGAHARAVRLQYQIGDLQNERPGGGFIEPAFANYLATLLDKYTPETEGESK